MKRLLALKVAFSLLFAHPAALADGLVDWHLRARDTYHGNYPNRWLIPPEVIPIHPKRNK